MEAVIEQEGSETLLNAVRCGTEANGRTSITAGQDQKTCIVIFTTRTVQANGQQQVHIDKIAPPSSPETGFKPSYRVLLKDGQSVTLDGIETITARAA